MPVKHPTWKPQSTPTPTDRLMVCDACGRSDWVTHGPPHVWHCCQRRMRDATSSEKKAAKAALEQR